MIKNDIKLELHKVGLTSKESQKGNKYYVLHLTDKAETYQVMIFDKPLAEKVAEVKEFGKANFIFKPRAIKGNLGIELVDVEMKKGA